MCRKGLNIRGWSAVVGAVSLLVLAGGLVCDVQAAIPTSERDALIALYNSTNGNSWNDNTNWLGAAGTEDTWFGVTVSNDQVVRMVLHRNQLTGTIPAELGNLVNVRQLYLGDNQLAGTIPPELGDLANIEILDFRNNRLTGTIPPDLGNLSNLQTLNLGNNQLLTGSIPAELSNLANLEELTLWDNQLMGTIPPELGNLTSLERLRLDRNQLTGTVPSQLGTLTNLEILRLHENQLMGTIPLELGNLTNLIELTVGNNQVTGTIPPELGKLTNLQILNLWDNQLTGPIPPELGTLPDLAELLLDRNQLSGTIPTELGNLANLERLRLHSNQLTGPIPPELGDLTALEVELRLENNQLTGTIPAELGNLASLHELRLANNQLTGPIPEELGNLTDLGLLHLEYNQLTGTIPTELSNLANLVGLHFSSNVLTGPIPAGLGSLFNLEGVHLDGNQLTGTIPPELGNLGNLKWLTLDNNQLAGTIPLELGNLTNLHDLILNDNQLTGNIPSELGNLSDLRHLTLHENQLTGTIPLELGDLTNLQYLWLNDNQLSGSIPHELGNLTELRHLSTGGNPLGGSIPSELGSLANLQELQMWDNHLTGPIPPELGNLSNLERLIIASNELEGPIPRALLNLTSMLDNESEFRWNKLYTNDAEVREFINRKQIGGDWESMQAITLTLISPDLLLGLYRMISVPLRASEPLEVFGDDLGAYDPAVWRLFWTDPDTGWYLEYPDVPDVSPGIAYWLITRDGGSVDATGSRVTDEMFFIDIPPGWFQVGNPFDGTVSKNDLKVKLAEISTTTVLRSLRDGNEDGGTKKDTIAGQARVTSTVPFSDSPLDDVLWEWNASESAWTTADTMVPWGGWLVYNNSTNPVTLIIPNPALASGPAAGSLQVTVIDALTGDVVEGATVTLEGFPPVTTDELGIATISATPTGTFTLTLEKTGYITYQQEITLEVGPNTPTIPLSPQLGTGETRIVLTWSEQPSDLDSHLTGPDAGGGRFHLYFGDRNPVGAGANLDLDDVSSFGPETITITEQRSGTYKYYVHDFTNQSDPSSTALAQSGAQIDVFREEGLAASFSVPSGAGTIWHVFNLDGETSAITPVNEMTSGDVPDNSMISSGMGGVVSRSRFEDREIGVIFRKLPRKPYGK